MTQRIKIGRDNSWKPTSWEVLGNRYQSPLFRTAARNKKLHLRKKSLWVTKPQTNDCTSWQEALHTIHNKFQKQFLLHIGDSFWIRTQQSGQPLSPMRNDSQFSRLADWRSQPSRDKRICIVDNKAFWLVPWSPRSSSLLRLCRSLDRIYGLPSLFPVLVEWLVWPYVPGKKIWQLLRCQYNQSSLDIQNERILEEMLDYENLTIVLTIACTMKYCQLWEGVCLINAGTILKRT